MSGRYFLNDGFDPELWSGSSFFARKYERGISTRLYGFSKEYFTDWQKALKRSLLQLFLGRSIEDVMPAKFGWERIHELKKTGSIRLCCARWILFGRMKPIQLTVFTEPISAEGFFDRVKSFFRPLKFFLQGKKTPLKKKYGGHLAVTRSLVEGLQKIGANFNYNPSFKRAIAENVIVLASVERLKKMIELKKKGRIKKLFAGPNVCESPAEAGGILTDTAVDVCIVNSEWTADVFLAERSDLHGRIDIWYAGVDTEFWQPSSRKRAEMSCYIGNPMMRAFVRKWKLLSGKAATIRSGLRTGHILPGNINRYLIVLSLQFLSAGEKVRGSRWQKPGP